MPNIGKIFENNFKASIPDTVFRYRPPDAAQSFDMGSKLRFSQKSPCDYFLFDGNRLYVFELKTFQGSCSFERTEEDEGIIHYYQIENLKKFSQYKNVISGLILDFRKEDHTYYLPISEFNILISNISKKSFNESDMLKWSNPTAIEKRKLKVNYRYNIEKLLKEIKG